MAKDDLASLEGKITAMNGGGRYGGLEIARKTVEKISSSCEGFCVSAPFGKVNFALDVIGDQK